jgi:hypothetical protein
MSGRQAKRDMSNSCKFSSRAKQGRKKKLNKDKEEGKRKK